MFIKKGLHLIAILLCSVLFFGFSGVGALTKSSPIQLTVPATSITVRGFAAPNALVTFLVDGSISGTVSADTSGYFSVTTASQSAGIHEVSLYYDDIQGVRSATFSKSVSVQLQQQSIIDVFLAPTLVHRADSAVAKGGVVQLSGYTIPGSSVVIDLNGATVVADSSGQFVFLIDSSSLFEGTYNPSVSANFFSQTSQASRPTLFSVVAQTQGPVIPDIVVFPDILPPPSPLSPGDGTVTTGNSVEVSGDSVPNAQINIFENGVLYGSIFANQSGKWSFVYYATTSPVVLSFEACIDSQCSVLSKSVTLLFTGLDTSCSILFELEKYRYWGVSQGERISLDVLRTIDDGVLTVDWGDGTRETLDHDASRPRSIGRSYPQPGQYNGSIEFRDGDCLLKRYFSVHVVAANQYNNRDLWLFLLLLLFLAPISYGANWYGRKYTRNHPVQND